MRKYIIYKLILFIVYYKCSLDVNYGEMVINVRDCQYCT